MLLRVQFTHTNFTTDWKHKVFIPWMFMITILTNCLLGCKSTKGLKLLNLRNWSEFQTCEWNSSPKLYKESQYGQLQLGPSWHEIFLLDSDLMTWAGVRVHEGKTRWHSILSSVILAQCPTRAAYWYLVAGLSTSGHGNGAGVSGLQVKWEPYP